MIPKKHFFILLVFAFVLTSGCANPIKIIKKTIKVVADPDIRIGDLEEQPTEISISIMAGDDINPNAYTSIDDLESTPDQDAESDSQVISDPEATSDSEAPSVSQAEPEPVPGSVAESAESAESAEPEPEQLTEQLPEHDQEKNEFIQLLDEYQSRLLAKIDSLVSENNPAVPSGSLQGGQAACTDTRAQELQGEPTPLKIILFQLTDISIFNSLDYDALFQNAKKSLGQSYVASQEYVIEPGQFKYIDGFLVEDKTLFLALAAFFNQHSDAIWKSSLKIIPKGEQYPLAIILQGNKAYLKKEN